MRAFLLSGLLAVVLCGAALAQAATAPWIGAYDSFDYASTPPNRLYKSDHERFSALRAAGLNTVLNYATYQMSLEENLRYADAAAFNAQHVIWGLHNYADGAPGTKWKLRLVKRTKNHPATLGYYVGDEVAPGTVEAQRMRKLTACIENRTKRLTVYTSIPVQSAVDDFLGMADVLAVDPYPVGHPALVGREAGYVAEVASWAGPMVRAAGDKLGMVLQLFSWADYGVPETGRWPTPEEVARMRAEAELGGPRVILWWSFYNVTDRQTLDYWFGIRPFLLG